MSKQSREELLVRIIIAAIVIGSILVVGAVSPTLEMYGL